MNITQNLQLGYFVLSFFFACIIIYFFHNGFQPIDILYIPILTVVIFLTIDIIAQFTIRKNTENFINENFIDYIPTSDNTIEHLTNEDPLEEESDETQPVQNTIPTTFPISEEEITLTPTVTTLAPTTSPMTTTPMTTMPMTTMPMTTMPMTTTPMTTTPMTTMPMTTTPMTTTPMTTMPMTTMPMTTSPMTTMPFEQTDVLGSSQGGGKTSQDSSAQNEVQGHTSIPLEEDETNINKYHMDTALDMPEMTNKNKNSNKPVNININYNNDRPYTHNDFSQRKFGGESGGRRPHHASACPAGDLLDPVNKTTVNTALKNMNQNYYPAYLENPLNKYQNGTSIKSTVDGMKKTKEDAQSTLIENEKMNKEMIEEDYDYERKMLLRANPESRKEKINKYLENSLQKICNNPNNNPAPVLLNDVWSEFKPLDLK